MLQLSNSETGSWCQSEFDFFFFQDLFEMKVSWYAQSVLR